MLYKNDKENMEEADRHFETVLAELAKLLDVLAYKGVNHR